MPLIVNGERIDDIQIEDEINRMRPQYQATFTDQTQEEQEKPSQFPNGHLLRWPMKPTDGWL